MSWLHSRGLGAADLMLVFLACALYHMGQGAEIGKRCRPMPMCSHV